MIETWKGKRHARTGLGLCGALGGLLWSGCLAQHEGPSSSDTATSWLSACHRDRDCAGDNVCLQSMCTLPCRVRDQRSCLVFGQSAQCEAQEVGTSFCDQRCSARAECKSIRADLECVQGHCRPPDEIAPDPVSMQMDAGDATVPGPEPTPVEAGAEDGAIEAEAGPAPLPGIPLSDDPGCFVPAVFSLQEFPDVQTFEARFLGKWAPCRTHPLSPRVFGDEASGAEFSADGLFYGLSLADGTFVRNGTVGHWRFDPPWSLYIGPTECTAAGTCSFTTNALFTDSPRSMMVGIDPTAPRFVPIAP